MSDLNLKLLAAQKDLKAPKGQFNSFGKYKYRSAEDILESVKPINAEHGLTLTLSDEPILIGDWHYIKATATVRHGEDQLQVTAYARESLNKKGMDDSQITGTASSYARKYALNGLYLIDDTKDADTDEYQKQSNQKSSSITQQQVGTLKTKALEFAKLANQTEKKVYEVLKITDVTKLNSVQADAAIGQLDTWIDNRKNK